MFKRFVFILFQISQLNTLITLLLGELIRQDRQKIMTICTIVVHSRDVVGRLIQSKIENVLAFQWQSQLRHRPVIVILKSGNIFCIGLFVN